MAKATKKQALGRGLSALLKDPSNDIQSVQDKNADKVIGNIVELDIDSITALSGSGPAYFFLIFASCSESSLWSNIALTASHNTGVARSNTLHHNAPIFVADQRNPKPSSLATSLTSSAMTSK